MYVNWQSTTFFNNLSKFISYVFRSFALLLTYLFNVYLSIPFYFIYFIIFFLFIADVLSYVWQHAQLSPAISENRIAVDLHLLSCKVLCSLIRSESMV